MAAVTVLEFRRLDGLDVWTHCTPGNWAVTLVKAKVEVEVRVTVSLRIEGNKKTATVIVLNLLRVDGLDLWIHCTIQD
jgi:hypothetical protein